MADTVRDIATLSRLRLRHARVELVRWLYVTGSDFHRETGVADRVYQVYIVAVMAACAAFLWFCLLSAAASLGATLSRAAAVQAVGLLYVSPVVVFMAALVRYLRVPLIKMTHPDIMWLANALVPRAWAATGLFGAVARAFAWGALGGFVAGVALRAVVSPASMGAALAAGLACAVGLAWLLGAARHVHFTRGPQRGPRFDMGSVVRASSLYADLQPLHSWAVQSPGAYEEARRRRIMAGRRPALGLPDADGRRLLLARAALSHVRQREGILDLLAWGAVAVPAGALSVAVAADGPLALAWAALAGALASRAKEVTRVYADDCRVRLVGDALGRSRFELLVLDSLPAAGLVAVSGLAVLAAAFAFLPVSAGQAAVAVCIAVSLAAVPLFAGGVGAMGSATGRSLPGFEVMVVGCALAVALASFAGPAWAAGAGAGCAAALGAWCWAGGRPPRTG